ncbi:MAG: bifunctional [glutamate--ammonia ligase]-adenylyl-L-tyrosine phosphorylase/[glutamate--ammonia-ligase] adenylyltransferase [Desulfuromonadaceae bacterium]|nr:bifunctional [glutamate--ammonia ligase]-adenylyl-L-tyrosine phosphorylase/[glutamate--ammonia-ligase] adenylyltransferase [Desulfuromonadaceae bacterium]MDD5106006.1 bifunctional [glutamate--ammonia ligase]-adenylyl-L-tyrosine phosphorylase/[glutamate--ammonia-ligase] adenylyltransferase [Desulfuromonadaceae bacterium]
MHVERFSQEFARILAGPDPVLQIPILASFLEAHGFQYGARTADNILLLKRIFTVETLHRIVVSALTTPSPDHALNSFERLTGVIPPESMSQLADRKKRLGQSVMLCGSSPFLVNLLYKSPDTLNWLLLEDNIDSGRTVDEMLSALQETVHEATDFAGLQKVLRCFKRREIVRIAARDLNGLAPLEEIMAELADLASSSLQIAYQVCRRFLIRDHGAPLLAEEPSGGREAEMTVIGMGKLGGRELNFSSDIDIIYFYESDRGETAGVQTSSGGIKGVISLHEFFNKLGEMISKALSQITEDGFVFRVDVGLRPEGKSGDMATSLRSAEVYYESWGQSWERTAMLKARPVAGSIALGEQLLKTLQPFIYRKYLDYNLIDDMKQMKQKIDASLARSHEGEINLKLGRGGIREIEFFIQALQLVYAGKNPRLRERNSLRALDSLLAEHLLSDDDHDKLREAYRFLRSVEHRIQVVQERQTHNLPTKEEEMLALARRCGYVRVAGLERFRTVLEEHRCHVSLIYGTLFHSRDTQLEQEVHPHALFLLDPKADSDLVKDLLAEHHFEDVDRAYDNLTALRRGPVKANLTERSRRTLGKIAPLLIQELFESPDPDLALAHLDRFMNIIASRSSCYALLAENRTTIKLLVSLFGMSEFLSKTLIGHPELLESLIAGGDASRSKSREIMMAELNSLMEQSDYFEDHLNIIRRYRNEEFLRIGLNDIHGRMLQGEVASQLSLLGEVCLEGAYRLAVAELSRFGRPLWQNNGTPAEANLAIIALGKLGGGELNYHSDLDIIFVYDHQGTTDGEKQISNHEYFAKLAQKIISILTMQTREGYVYKIDTRLRPSGNAGPLVTSLESFLDYHRTEAQIWERQALTKARIVLGDDTLATQLYDIIRQTVYGCSIDENGRAEIHRLRMRMENELARERDGSYNIKTGRGGMVDVEFAVQYLQLKEGRHFPELRTNSTIIALKEISTLRLIPDDHAKTLLDGYKFLRKLENRLRIIHDYSVNDLSGTKIYLNRLARRLGYDSKLKTPGITMICDYEEITGKIRDVFDRLFVNEDP